MEKISGLKVTNQNYLISIVMKSLPNITDLIPSILNNLSANGDDAASRPLKTLLFDYLVKFYQW